MAKREIKIIVDDGLEGDEQYQVYLADDTEVRGLETMGYLTPWILHNLEENGFDCSAIWKQIWAD